MAEDDHLAAAQHMAAVFQEAASVQRAARDQAIPAAVEAALAIRQVCLAGGKVLAVGNGGSAADAQHFAAELVGRFERNRAAMAAIALTTDSSILTSIGNDFGYDSVFARQVQALGRRDDILVAISTSGGSANVLAAARAARELGLTVVALTGRDGGALGALADIHVNVPHASTARVQEVHIMLLHAICGIVEAEADTRHA